MHISVTYYPNGVYDGKGNSTGYKQYKLKIYHHLGVDGHDFAFINKYISASEVLNIIRVIKQHKDHNLIKVIYKGNNIREFIIKTII